MNESILMNCESQFLNLKNRLHTRLHGIREVIVQLRLDVVVPDLDVVGQVERESGVLLPRLGLLFGDLPVVPDDIADNPGWQLNSLFCKYSSIFHDF